MHAGPAKFGGKPFLSLKSFIVQSNVLSQYRSMLRALAGYPVADKRRLQQQIREGFEQHRDETDSTAINYLLSKGEEQLKFLRGGNKSMSATDSWIGKGPADDIHGRVGTGWPWKK